MWRLPDTVGGGVSIEKIWSRVFERSNANVRFDSQCFDHFCSSPSTVGFSGTDDMVCPRYLRRFGDQDSVLAVALRLQQRVVGVLQHLVEGRAVTKIGDTERRREHRCPALVDRERQLFAQPL